MVQIKKIIFFLFIFCFLFTKAQENNLKEEYKKLENHEEKLDFIFNNIVLKQIKDFQKLEKERDLLKKHKNQQTVKLLQEDTLSKSKKIQELQSDVWGYQSELETHTVETHIYRLRKKILKIFNDKNFIISNKDGYEINKKE